MTGSTEQTPARKTQAFLKRGARCLYAATLTGMLSACGSSVHSPATTAAATGPQLYMTPVIYGGPTAATAIPATYSISDTALTFTQQTYFFSNQQSGPQVQYAGNLAALSRGLLALQLTYACGTKTADGCTGIQYTQQTQPQPPPGWALELPGQGGGLLQLNSGQPVVPMVAAVACPAMSSAQPYLFVTLPDVLITGGATAGTNPDSWNPALETAYGSVDISASGDTVKLTNINQYLLPQPGAGTPAPTSTPGAPASATGACSQTVYGHTVAVPANPTITTSSGGTATESPQAMIGIGPSGLLVEDNGTAGEGEISPYYENVLGAGTGAIGLPQPSSAISASSLAGAQYLGFFFGGGSSVTPPNEFSSVASFGFPSPQSGCPQVNSQTTVLYGGDLASNNPGSPNCDFAVDLGVQDTSTNGLFPGATVYVFSGFTTTSMITTSYSFPAVAIAGQLNGKYAIFLIGEDTNGSPNQAWGIYLLQSN
jgi:hypothetical protein